MRNLRTAPWWGYLLVITALVMAAAAYDAHAAGMMGVGHLMGPSGALGGSDSGSGILTESNSLITTEAGVILRTE